MKPEPLKEIRICTTFKTKLGDIVKSCNAEVCYVKHIKSAVEWFREQYPQRIRVNSYDIEVLKLLDEAFPNLNTDKQSKVH